MQTDSKPTHDEKVRRAKEVLGDRYLMHPSKRVKRLAFDIDVMAVARMLAHTGEVTRA